MRQLGAKYFTRNLTIWSKTENEWGGNEWGQPVRVDCWFKSTNETFNNTAGQEQVAKYKILMGADALQYLGDYYYVAVDQDLTNEPDPTRNGLNTWEIGSWGQVAADAIGSKDVVIVMV